MSTGTAKVRILAVDDHPIVREGIDALIAIQPDMVLVGEASDGREAIQQFRMHRPDLTLMRRVKEAYDPEGALNPGRFAGGI